MREPKRQGLSRPVRPERDWIGITVSETEWREKTAMGTLILQKYARRCIHRSILVLADNLRGSSRFRVKICVKLRASWLSDSQSSGPRDVLLVI